MLRLHSIKSRLVFFSVVAFMAVALSVSFSYFISVGEVKSIMRSDVGSVADAMEKSLEYIARVKPDAYRDKNFKKAIYDMKLGKTGYMFMLDDQGTLVVHKKDEGKNLAGQPHIDFIRTHKEGGFYEYTANTTGQDKIVAFRYIKPWNLWIVPGVNKDDYFNELKSSFLKWNIIFCAAVILVLGFIGYRITRGISHPVKSAAELANLMAEGDLTGKVKMAAGNVSDSSHLKLGTCGEIGELTGSLNGMVENLNRMVGNVTQTSEKVFQISNDISAASKRVTGSAEVQVEASNNTSAAMTQIISSIKGVSEGVHEASRSVSECSSSVSEVASSMEDMAQNAEMLAKSVEEVSSSIIEMTVAMKQVGNNVESLLESAETTASSIVEMDGSIGQVDENASATATIVQDVSKDAAAGQQAVQAMIEGMGEIRESSRITSDVIDTLSARAKAIGNILSVIDEVAAQTKLLALNAAIIAAQAGEQGKGFSVVADEIKKLAERTSSSTQEIETVIKGVQEETRRAVEAIAMAEKSIAEGEILSRKSGEALDMIVDGAGKAAQQMHKIAKATEEQGKGSGLIRDAMENIIDMVEQIARAMQEQEKGSEQIITNATKMKEITNRVRNSTIEQSGVASLIARNTEELKEMICFITSACDEQKFGGEQVMVAAENIRHSTNANLEAIQVMNEALANLYSQADILKKEMNSFRV